jgi:hypothetical protein|tara:strand:- start:6545 stop:6916 length:372 start_codon:yes stop_codon:yes gene_type:complete
MVLSKKAVQFVSGGIISSYITTHYLEQSKHLGVFKHSTKLNVQRTLNDLIKIEQDYFNETENVDDKDLSDRLVANKLTFIDEFLKFDFADFTKLQEVFVAFTKDRKRLVSISDKILIADKAKK